MSIGNAIVNQALGAANRAATGGLKKVLGNLPDYKILLCIEKKTFQRYII